MPKFAIVENGRVSNVVLADGPMADNWVPAGVCGVGWVQIGGGFFPPPSIRITGLYSGGQPLPLSNRALLSAGGSLRVTARAESGDSVIPMTDSFALPICRVQGGVDQTVLIQFFGGVADFTVDFPRSGEYVVLEDWANMHLPPEKRLSLNPFYISVTS